jgi:hypothetical protein
MKWMRVLEAAGIVFVGEDDACGAGVRWKKGWPKEPGDDGKGEGVRSRALP